MTPPAIHQRVRHHHHAPRSLPTDPSRHLSKPIQDYSENNRYYDYIDHYQQEDFYERTSSVGSSQYSYPSSPPFDESAEYEIQYAREIYSRNYRSHSHGNVFNLPSQSAFQESTSIPSNSPPIHPPNPRHSIHFIPNIPLQHHHIADGENYLPPPPAYADYYPPATATITAPIPANPPNSPSPPATTDITATTVYRNNAYTRNHLSPPSSVGFSSPSSSSFSLSQTSSRASPPPNMAANHMHVVSAVNGNANPNFNVTVPTVGCESMSTNEVIFSRNEHVASSPSSPVIADLPKKETRREKKLRRKQMAFKTKLCRNYSKGFCQFGNNCQFAHGQEELQHYS